MALVGEADVNGHAIVVRPATPWRRHIALPHCAAHGIPHLLLHTQRPRRIIDDEAIVGIDGTELLQCFAQRFGSWLDEIGAPEVTIHVLVGEVVGGGILQADGDARPQRGQVHQSSLAHPCTIVNTLAPREQSQQCEYHDCRQSSHPRGDQSKTPSTTTSWPPPPLPPPPPPPRLPPPP